jgi:phospholipid/cholesterol/gamma-HCH transport system substrate-binding protein
MLMITRGETGDPIAPGSEFRSEEPSDFMRALGEMKGDAQSTMGDVKRVAKELADERLHSDLRAAVKKVDTLLGQVTEGEGYPKHFLTDPEEAKRISRTIDNLDRTAAELATTLREVRQITEQVRTGPGLAHDLLYGDGLKKPVEQIGVAAEEVGLALREVRTGKGLAHDVLFGSKDGAGDAVGNVTAITADARDIVRGIKDGKGTLGALLVDPSVYEDVKRLIGNVERNAVLRSLVRYSIQQNDAPPPRVGPAKAP